MRLIAKRSKKTISQEILAAYVEAKALHEKYTNCIRDIVCDAPSINVHCNDCLRHIELNRFINQSMDIRPWEPGPFDDGELHDKLELAIEERSRNDD